MHLLLLAFNLLVFIQIGFQHDNQLRHRLLVFNLFYFPLPLIFYPALSKSTPTWILPNPKTFHAFTFDRFILVFV
jgi:hypothetical protein